MAGKLDGKVVVLLGAGQTEGETLGNGRAASLAYAREGAYVFAADRNMGSALETVSMIEAEGGKAVAAELDVTDEAGVRTLLQDVEAQQGRLDILHNNVGISLAGGDAEILDIEEIAFDRIMSVNLKSMVFACKHALPIMRRQGGGCIINISSTAALTPNPLIGYKLSKLGVVGLTETLAVSNAEHGIRVNCILPGLLDTPMAIANRVQKTGKTSDQIRQERQARVPLKGRMGTAWDVANAAIFLASEDAGYITGISLVIDGGRSLKVS
jgi:NAD(P)-dependent dehydrogenase (short-subunit alcohol dehydrogenase family)